MEVRMKVKIFDDESGEQLLEGDLNLSHVKQLLKTSLLKIQLVDYQPIHNVMPDYKDPLVGWCFDEHLDLWFKVLFLNKIETFVAILKESVPFPSQMVWDHEERYQEGHRAAQAIP
jgi:hypothetical protein